MKINTSFYSARNIIIKKKNKELSSLRKKPDPPTQGPKLGSLRITTLTEHGVEVSSKPFRFCANCWWVPGHTTPKILQAKRIRENSRSRKVILTYAPPFFPKQTIKSRKDLCDLPWNRLQTLPSGRGALISEGTRQGQESKQTKCLAKCPVYYRWIICSLCPIVFLQDVAFFTMTSIKTNT